MKTMLKMFFAVLMILLSIGSLFAQTELYNENFGTTTTMPTGWTVQQPAVANTWSVTTSAPSSDYTGASGGSNLIASNNGSDLGLQIIYNNNLSTVGFSNIKVIWGARRTGTFTNTVTVEWSSDGTTWNTFPTYTDVPPVSGGPWALVNGGTEITLPSGAAGVSNLRFRFTYDQLNNFGNYRIDDFIVKGTPSVVYDGDGTASIVNSTASSTLNGSLIFPRNTGSQSVTITVTGTVAGTLDQVRVTVPTGFTGVAGSTITLGGAFAGNSATKSGQQITMSSAALGTTPGTIQIDGLTSPNYTAALQNGNDTFYVATAKLGGTLKNIRTSPKTYTIIPIKNIRTGGVDGYGNTSIAGDTASMRGQVVAIAGVITVETGILQPSTNTSGVIQSGGYGIELFQYGTPATTFARGDSVILKGMISPYKSSTEIIPSTFGSPNFYNIGAGSMPASRIFSNASVVAESLECVLIKISSATFDSVGKTFRISDSLITYNNFRTSVSDTGTLFLSSTSMLVGRTIPASGYVEGVVLQRNLMYGGHQTLYKVAPRGVVDIGLDPADGSGTATIVPTVNFYGFTAQKETLTVTGDGISTITGMSVAIPATWTWDGSSFTLLGAGFSSASGIVSGTGTTLDPWVITVSGAAITNLNLGSVAMYNLNTPLTAGSTRFIVNTKGATGSLLQIVLSPSVSIAGPFEAVATGDWSNTATWSQHIVPGASDDVTMNTKNVVVTISGDATCHNLLMNGSGVTGVGPILQFAATGTPTLTVNGKLEITGTSSVRPKLTSNGNNNATLILKKYTFTNVSNATANNNAGLNMNEGTVKFIGASYDTLKTDAGFRLGNLVIGDGTDAKTLVWLPTAAGTMIVKGITVKTNSSFIVGGTTYVQTNAIGNYSTAGMPMLTQGVTIESGASFTINNASSGTNLGHLNIKNGGISNSGTFGLKSANGSRTYALDIGGFTADPSGSKQTIGGTAVGSYYGGTVASADTLILNQSMNMVTGQLTINGNGRLWETPDHTVLGLVGVTKSLTQSTLDSMNGVGVVINASGAAPGSTTIHRYTNVSQTGKGKNSILRYYDISPITNVGLNATMDIYYDDSELNGQDSSKLLLWKSEDNGVTWNVQASTVDVVNHKLHTNGINSFSRWTMSDQANAIGDLSKDYYYNAGWNMISLPVKVADSLKIHLYPHAISDAFAYEGQYVSKDIILNGIGYWFKFASKDTVPILGIDRTSDSVSVVDGWNMIGTLSQKILVNTITTNPPTLLPSDFFGYTNSYNISDTLLPGQAYWVKTHGAGKLYLSGTPGLARQISSSREVLKEMNILKVTDKNGVNQTLYFGSANSNKNVTASFDVPPIGFEGMFDVRFATQKYAELVPVKSDNIVEYPISIYAKAYPLTISWNAKSTGTHSFMLKDGSVFKQQLNGEGKIMVNQPFKNLMLQAISRDVLPSQFSLSANYPNPFNPSTKFTIAIPKTAMVDVVIYDILGRKVRTLVSGVTPAGYQTIEWNGLTEDGATAPSGVYFIRMVSEKFNATQKIMMLK